MATAADTYTWATYGTPLKAHLGVSGSAEDASLTLWLASAAEDCDDFCGTLPTVHPTKIKLGIYEWVRAYRAVVQRPGGTTSVRTGALAETYSTAEAGRAARQAAQDLWMASVVDVSLRG